MGSILKEFKYIWPFNHQNEFEFKPTTATFSVEEIPLYEFSGSGEHLILKVRKKNLTTWEMIDIISSHIGIKKREIGYAGLKDKHAITTQYISMPKIYEDRLKDLSHPQIKILDIFYHNNKIRVGHLKGNRFWMRFKRVKNTQRVKLDTLIKWIKNSGMPNYFGVQRFGNSGLNYLEGKDIIDGTIKLRDRKKREFLISAYQSFLFNNIVAKRVELCNLLESFKSGEVEKIFNFPKDSLKDINNQKQFFKLLDGDLYMHYPFGKIFYEETQIAVDRFSKKDISPTGLIAGKRVKYAKDLAFEIEKEYNYTINQPGSRRYLWIFPDIEERRYIQEEGWYELKFYLPKGSYATVLVDFLKGNIAQK